MSGKKKNQKNILSKLNIEKLNPMQEEAKLAVHAANNIILLSPTGTGKTLAFMLPIVAELDPDCPHVQVLILVPSRELAIQIEQVTRDMGTGYKCNAFYGGRNFSKDRIDLNRPPAILIGTPGRIADHLRRETFYTGKIKTLVLDEFDKSLEVGFEKDMEDIVSFVPDVEKKILTSATHRVRIPEFLEFKNPLSVNYLKDNIPELALKTIISPEKDKLETLVKALSHLGNQPGIIFCNFKESIQRVSDFLTERGISHGTFYGGMEQIDRERVLIKFRNGTHRLIVATDLAARGLDIPELKFILHYHLPLRFQEFTHRNGRTARMHSEGTAYILKWANEELPEFIPETEIEELQEAPLPAETGWETLFISGGRKDKISKGDIAGLFFKQGNLNKNELGVIELKLDCAFVAIQSAKVQDTIEAVNNTKLKNKKVRITVV
ncbi:DEAD/DEAH box helicase [Draconibacterium halophilum]|uniref:DEAD/DEAH box helicase n=1 Tax=Draconibacterium halophilum TaxID=2706887 RepID=A0A6C0RH09_9BACT|nr:DEAD/DEAH box helicase [Draconibacterium halophilum]QIA09379.1 DEAD/DEAH box helicase [Draconibacterium halophilum]